MILGEQLYGVVPLGSGEDVPGGGTFALTAPDTVGVSVTANAAEFYEGLPRLTAYITVELLAPNIYQATEITRLQTQLITVVGIASNSAITGGAPSIGLQTQTKYVTVTMTGTENLVDRGPLAPDTATVLVEGFAAPITGGTITVPGGVTTQVTVVGYGGVLEDKVYNCTDLIPVAMWPGYSSDGTNITIPIASLVNLGQADADATTGDWQEIARAFLQTTARCMMLQSVYTELETVDAIDSLIKVDASGRWNRNVQRFTIHFPCHIPAEEP